MGSDNDKGQDITRGIKTMHSDLFNSSSINFMLVPLVSVLYKKLWKIYSALFSEP